MTCLCAVSRLQGGLKGRGIGAPLPQIRIAQYRSPEALRQQLFLGICQLGGETLPILSGA